ncbi:MAG: 4-(cytidine 5'-diphospho)-2-C-methyl-D-erythritol kinase [Chlorobi bacterium]|nr:4-(cytidine 5'-diphospho)-2-C-methyl-D-erythritol kinase [Chlorobiota bacterium]
MIVFPNVKINLGLKILRKREDGYHDLETVYIPAGFCDILEIIPARKRDSFSQSGIPLHLQPGENLVMQVVNTLRNQYSFPPVSIYLHKRIPPGSGLGGGSADAAFTLILLNRIFRLNIDRDRLSRIAMETGSDCPFFLINHPVFASGRGESMTPLKPIHGRFHLKIIIPPFSITTAEAYRLITPNPHDPPPASVYRLPLEKWKGNLINRFEKVICKEYPMLREIITRLYERGAIYAALSGSGSAVYGIYKKDPGTFPGIQEWLVWSGEINL